MGVIGGVVVAIGGTNVATPDTTDGSAVAGWDTADGSAVATPWIDMGVDVGVAVPIGEAGRGLGVDVGVVASRIGVGVGLAATAVPAGGSHRGTAVASAGPQVGVGTIPVITVGTGRAGERASCDAL